MSKSSKAYKAAAEKVDKDKLYSPLEAAELAKETSSKNTDSTVEVAIRLGVDPRKADQMVRGTVNLPHGTGKTARVIVFAAGDKAAEAVAAGADEVGAEDLIEKIQGGWLDFDAAIATPDQMAKVGRIARVLGPRGLMPNPKTGTVTTDVTKAINDIKGGKINFRVDKQANLHFVIGKASFDAEKLADVAGFEVRRTASEAKGLKRGIGYSSYIEACGRAADAQAAAAIGAHAEGHAAGVAVHDVHLARVDAQARGEPAAGEVDGSRGLGAADGRGATVARGRLHRRRAGDGLADPGEPPRQPEAAQGRRLEPVLHLHRRHRSDEPDRQQPDRRERQEGVVRLARGCQARAVARCVRARHLA